MTETLTYLTIGLIPGLILVDWAIRGRKHDSTRFWRLRATLVTIGMKDSVVLPSMGDYIVEHVPGARASRYEGVGHVPFGEDPSRFNAELASLVADVNG